MPEEKLKSWQVPTFEASPESRNGWVTEQIQDGSEWWRNQAAAKDAEANMRLITGDSSGRKVPSNNLKADSRKFVETIADVREIATYGTGAEQFKKIAEMYNRILKHVYYKSEFTRQSRKALQWAVGGGRGYLWPRYIRKDFGWGEGVVVFQDLAGCDVLPSQLPTDSDVQGAYACTIMETLGIAEAHARFPSFQSEILPISKTRPTDNNHVRRLESWDRWRFNGQSDWDRRYAEFRHTFVRDLRVNRTGHPLEMGDKNTSWFYSVPSVGQLVESINPENGLPESHSATVDECRIYPQLRLIISNPGMKRPCYDGPAFDWHGIIPAVAYDVDDWPWLAVGLSLINDVAGIERAEREYLDLMYRVLRVNMNPPVAYDLDAGIPREDIKSFNWLDESGTKLGVNGDPKKGIVSALPEGIHVKEIDFKMLETLGQRRQKSLGLNDLGSLEKLKFNLSSENVDKILETIGPIAKGIAGNLERAHTKLANMLKFIIPQYFTTRKLMSYIGPDATAVEVFDYDPQSIVPSHLPGEKPETPSSKPKMDRAKWFAQNLEVISVPSQLLNVTAMQEQMKYLNFLQRGFPISFSTAFKKLAPDIAWPDVPGKDELDRYEWEQRRIMKIKLDVMKSVAGDMPPGAAGAGKEKGKGGGRPPSGQAPPKLESRGNKSGNPRTVLSQSK